MNNYTMTCTCGHEYSVEAETKEAAVEQLKGMMTEEKIAEHMAESHKPDEPVPTKEQADMMIEQTTKEA